MCACPADARLAASGLDCREGSGSEHSRATVFGDLCLLVFGVNPPEPRGLQRFGWKKLPRRFPGVWRPAPRELPGSLPPLALPTRWAEELSPEVLICISPVTNGVERLFTCTLVICTASFGRHLFKSLEVKLGYLSFYLS